MKTVLLAYDRDQDLAALETLLQSRNHRVLKSRSGVEALEVARREAPHVIVSDVLLPKLDGFALCRRVKEDPLLAHVPVLILSFRVEGPKYEAFAAEVGAERFFPRGSQLEDLASTLDELSHGSGTLRMPALVPELIEKREQDRRRVNELERQIKELEGLQQRAAVSERVAREIAERATREKAEHAAADAARISELQARLQGFEARQRQLTQAESAARGAAEQNQAELARVGLLETRLAELQSARARAQAAAVDAERAFAAQPVPTWLSDMETHELRVVSDSAAVLFGFAPESLRGRSILELLDGYAPDAEPTAPAEVTCQRADGARRVLELRRQSVSYSGRACWLTAARDVTDERAERAAVEVARQHAAALQHLPLAACLADDEGRLRYANAAFLELAGLVSESVAGATLGQFATEGEGRWRRADGTVLDVEMTSAPAENLPGLRVVVVRDASAERLDEQRNEREQRRTTALLDLTQRSHSLTETEILTQSLELASELTGSAAAYLFMALPEAGQLEVAASHGGDPDARDLSVLTRWRGAPPAETALHECVTQQKPVVRDAVEGTGVLRQAGLPGSLNRQVCAPMLDGTRLAGVLLLAGKAASYADEDLRHATQVADAAWKVLRRRRSDAEVVSAMDHMERVMLGVVESLATAAESQDACKAGRSRRVGDLAAAIGTAVGLPGHTVRGLRVMGEVIDVGMLQIPREILWRPGQLSPSEYELVKTHAERGYESLRRVEFPWPVAEVVREHHERLDGSGYPRGLQGEEILLEARIVAVADAAEAMLAPRPQRAALSLTACIEELQSQAGRRYDARVVKACVKLLRERETRPEQEATVGQRIA
ncbi:MAG: response regulator [Steroidobacteraceae bacterium]|nr:response regulator [Steroidobacteraceae bacterium]